MVFFFFFSLFFFGQRATRAGPGATIPWWCPATDRSKANWTNETSSRAVWRLIARCTKLNDRSPCPSREEKAQVVRDSDWLCPSGNTVDHRGRFSEESSARRRKLLAESAGILEINSESCSVKFSKKQSASRRTAFRSSRGTMFENSRDRDAERERESFAPSRLLDFLSLPISARDDERRRTKRNRRWQ